MEMINTIGRRKRAVARLYVTNGNGSMTVNGKPSDKYFPQPHIHNKILAPFFVLEEGNPYNWKIRVEGGGFKGQAEAIRLAISRALSMMNEDFHKPLKERKYLTRDARVVERKKYGKPKARKSFQFSKR